jgi:hypothetical protein
MCIKRPLVVHHLVFAIYPILHLYATNLDRVSLRETLVPLAVSLGMTVVLFRAINLLLKESNKAGLLTSATLILFFSYGHVCGALKLRQVAIWDWVPDRLGYLVILWGLLFLLAVLLVVRIRNDLRSITTCLNVVSALLIAAPLLTLGVHSVRHVANGPRNATLEDQIQLEVADKLPDIYYIILDSYGRADILDQVCRYDNSEFIKRLTAKGFYVAFRSRSNYSLSFLSLASSLNMEYLNDLRDELGPESTDMTIASSTIEDNRVQRTLRRAGYRFVHFSSGYGPTDHNRFADINYRSGVDNDFRIMLLQTTMLNLVSPHYAAQKRARTLFAFETIGEIPQIEEPTFVFAHLMVPHFPFVFDRYCDPQPLTQGLWGFRGAIDLCQQNGGCACRRDSGQIRSAADHYLAG